MLRTNKLLVSLNKNVVEQEFDIYTVRMSEGNVSQAINIVDSALEVKNVLSVVYIDGYNFWLLMKKDNSNYNVIQSIQNLEGGDSVRVEPAKVNELPQHVILQLLLNSLGTRKTTNSQYNNLTGHFYCFNKNSLKRSKNIINQISRVGI